MSPDTDLRLEAFTTLFNRRICSVVKQIAFCTGIDDTPEDLPLKEPIGEKTRVTQDNVTGSTVSAQTQNGKPHTICDPDLVSRVRGSHENVWRHSHLEKGRSGSQFYYRSLVQRHSIP